MSLRHRLGLSQCFAHLSQLGGADDQVIGRFPEWQIGIRPRELARRRAVQGQLARHQRHSPDIDRARRLGCQGPVDVISQAH